jgi:hypothetical protein
MECLPLVMLPLLDSLVMEHLPPANLVMENFPPANLVMVHLPMDMVHPLQDSLVMEHLPPANPVMEHLPMDMVHPLLDNLVMDHPMACHLLVQVTLQVVHPILAVLQGILTRLASKR